MHAYKERDICYTVEELREKIVPIAIEYGLAAVWLFGSYARGDATKDSDVDILIDRTGSCVSSLFELGAVYNDLYETVGEIDMVTTRTLFQDEDELSMEFGKNILKERILIYEKQ
ncbi:MAG: nucleotidyltransferase domain-containing protein [Endomicrobium sp.]|nr:nucleotidyltransferase domain-containing protein [Endomicrobium sp.]